MCLARFGSMLKYNTMRTLHQVERLQMSGSVTTSGL